jgi:hypothetical protein
MIPPQTLVKALVQRLLPAPSTASGPEADKALRCGPYGDLKVESIWPTEHLQADEGAYMVACMAPGQAVINTGIAAAYNAVAPTLVLFNNAPLGGPNLYPKYFRMGVSVIPSSAANVQFSLVVDPANRQPAAAYVTNTAGTVGPGTGAANKGYRSQISCVNMNVNPQINGIAYLPNGTTSDAAGITVPSASAGARIIVGNGMLKYSAPIALDQYTIQFGGTDRGGTIQAAAALCKIVEHAPPVVVGPQQTMLLYLWCPSNITLGFVFSDMSLEWVER